MNIFFLDRDIIESVKAHIDAHVIKMPLEAAQILSTNLWIDRVLGYKPRALTSQEILKLREAVANTKEEVLYKPVMFNHPCTIWARERLLNFEYVRRYAILLGEEKKHRWPNNSPHKSVELVSKLPGLSDTHAGWSDPAMAMPTDYKEQATDIVDAYRTYYVCEKVYDKSGNLMAKWTNRDAPYWWEI